MFNADPTVALKIDLADNLREAMLDQLENLGAPEVGQFRKDYGSVSKVGQMAYRNIVNSEGQRISALGGSSPAKTGMMLTGELLLATHNLPAAAVGAGGSLLRGKILQRGLKNPTMRRAIESWAKSSASPEPYEFKQPQAKGLLPSPAIVTPPPADVSGIQPPKEPYTHYGTVNPRDPLQLPQGQAPIVTPEGRAVGGNIPEAERQLQNRVIVQTGEPAHPPVEPPVQPTQDGTQTTPEPPIGGTATPVMPDAWKGTISAFTKPEDVASEMSRINELAHN
jgi:hypothetical protein